MIVLRFTSMTEIKSVDPVKTRMEGAIDPCILRSYEGYEFDTVHGPFVEDVATKARSLWDTRNPLNRHIATELVLGRKVDVEEVVDRPDLIGHIVRVNDPERAVSALQMLRLIEQQ